MKAIEDPAVAAVQSVAFRDVLGFEVTEWEPGRAVLSLALTPAHHNRNGFVHGGVFMSLLDSAASLCGVHCSVPGHVRRCTTVSMNTQFIAPASSGLLRAEGTLVSRGRKLYFAESRLTCDGTLIATAQGAFRFVLGGENENGVPME